MSKILVVDDEHDVIDLVALHLLREGHQCIGITEGLAAFPAALEHQPDLILLDLMLPDMDGIQIFRRLREDSRTKQIPVVFLTAKSQLNDRIAGLELGGDDYVTKPFSPRELLLRIQAVLRRTKRTHHLPEVKMGKFLLDRKSMRAFVDGNPVDLTYTEFKLLATLMETPSVVNTRNDLLREVWGYSDEAHTRTLDTHIKRLREKLGQAGCHVVTVRGLGYQFMELPTS